MQPVFQQTFQIYKNVKMDHLMKAIKFWDTDDPIDTSIQTSETKEDIENKEDEGRVYSPLKESIFSRYNWWVGKPYEGKLGLGEQLYFYSY